MNLDTKTGMIIKNYNGYYYVKSEGNLVACKIRGKFKKNRFSLLTGDNVVFSQPLPESEGSIEEVLPRRNRLLKPAVANIDQIVLVFAVENPVFNQNILDRFLVMAEQAKVPVTICLSKIDLLDEYEQINDVIKLYQSIGYNVIKLSAKEMLGIEQLKQLLSAKTTVFAGLSGAGKSTLLNALYPGLELATGKVSSKNKKGRHTTRFSQFIETGEGYLVDTPGFSFAETDSMKVEDVKNAFKEFHNYVDSCRFAGCLHINEPACAVKQALGEDLIDDLRYQNYVALINECKENEEREFK